MASSSQSTKSKKLLTFGTIIKPHGLKGNLFCLLNLELPKLNISALIKHCYLPDGTKFKIERCTPHAYQKHLLKLAEINSREQAERLKNSLLFFYPEAVPQQGYFLEQLVDCAVLSKKGEAIGIITSIYELRCHFNMNIKNKNKEYEIPIVPQLIEVTDIKNKKVILSINSIEEFYGN